METYRRKAEYLSKDAAGEYLGKFSSRGQKEHEATTAALMRAFERISGVTRILDLPCGAGRFTDFFYAKGYFYVGADVSQEMIDIAAGGQRSQARSLRLVRCEAEALPFKDNAFDCVASIRFLTQQIPIPVRQKMLQEMRRVSRAWLIVQSHRLKPTGPLTQLKIFVRELFGADVNKYRVQSGILNEGWKEEERIPVEGKSFYVGVYKKSQEENL